MIKLTTDCSKCEYAKVCKYKGRAEADMNKLKKMRYGDGPNDDYGWGTMMESRNVDITFSCPDFKEVKPVWR